jgi:hypothetical protein
MVDSLKSESDKPKKVTEFIHPEYLSNALKWEKWRLTYIGGDDFIDRYTEKFSVREDSVDFLTRKRITYCPAFAKAAVNDIKNSIFQRMVDISRKGGSPSYQKAVLGKDDGVDLLGRSMNNFIGQKVLPELLSMAKVGIYVDAPPKNGESLIDTKDFRPYIYYYAAEDIQSWTFDEGVNSNEFRTLLLVDHYYQPDQIFSLPDQLIKRYRYYYIENGIVNLRFYDVDGHQVDQDGYATDQPTILGIDKIPFIVLGLSDSLLSDAANYQIALLNLSSSDMSYALKSNFPFYTEQFDPRTYSEHLKPAAEGQTVLSEAGLRSQEIVVGVTGGRRYPMHTERPDFINPSPDPLRVSMEKQEVLKEEIRLLVNLAVTNIKPKMASAESKSYDQQGLESGLSYIGLELEHAERRIAEFWSLYEGTDNISTITYPEKYSLKSEEDRRKDAEALDKLKSKVPSKTYRKVVDKQIADITVGCRVSTEILEQIYQEIDEADVPSSDNEILAKDVEIGLVSAQTASIGRGYDKGEVEKAKKEHADRLARIAIAQSEGAAASRGISDQGSTGGSGSAEKKLSRDTEQDDSVIDKTRGKALSSKANGNS